MTTFAFGLFVTNATWWREFWPGESEFDASARGVALNGMLRLRTRPSCYQDGDRHSFVHGIP
ncbi:MAG: hypothetical protein ACI8P0_005353 [Planctomycetaceae bacterium]